MRAAVIGNSADILLNKNGELIDSSDRIVRINSFRLDGVESHTGTRIDIVVINLARDVLLGALPHSADSIRQARELWTPVFSRESIVGAGPDIERHLGIEASRIRTATEVGAAEALHLAYRTGQEAFDRIVAGGRMDAHVSEFGSTFMPTTGFLTIFMASQVFRGWDIAITGFGLNAPLSPERFDTSGAGMWNGHCLAAEREVLLGGVAEGRWRAI